MDEDTKIFLKYMAPKSEDIKNVLKRPSTWFYVCLILAIIILAGWKNNSLAVIMFFILIIIAILIQSYLIKKSGIHRYWYKTKYENNIK